MTGSWPIEVPHVSATATRPPRTKPPEQRREELMDAAERLFIGSGIRATSIDAIVAAAGVAKGTFYLHFATKDDVVVALIARYAERYGLALSAAVAACAPGDWPGRLTAWVDAAVLGLLAGGDLAETVFHQHPQPASNVLERSAAAPLADLLAGGNAAGAWQVREPALLATFIFAGLHGAIDDLLFRQAELDREAIRRSMHGFAVALVQPAIR